MAEVEQSHEGHLLQVGDVDADPDQRDQEH